MGGTALRWSVMLDPSDMEETLALRSVSMEIKRAGTQPSTRGSSDYLTGTVRALTHIAAQEQLDGKNVEWMAQVSDDQYLTDRSAN
jgi:hypothetical protein